MQPQREGGGSQAAGRRHQEEDVEVGPRLPGDLEVGRSATFVGEVKVADFGPRRGRQRTFSAVLGDESGVVTLKWFRGGESVAQHVKKGVRLRASGEVRRYKFSKEVIHPEIDLLREGEPEGAGEGIVPDYPVPEGIPPRTFRRWVAAAVAQFSDLVPSTLPARLVAERQLPPTPEALRRIHRPEADAEPEALRRQSSAAHERPAVAVDRHVPRGDLRRRGRRAPFRGRRGGAR